MKAIRIHEYGGPEVLQYEDVVVPTPAAGELLIKVQAASVNPLDWKTRAGYLKGLFPHTLPFILGWDASGVVEAVGSGVTKFKKGDEVYTRTNRDGTYAEYAILNETEAALKPKSVDHVSAAAIPLAALTAWQALFEKAQLTETKPANSTTSLRPTFSCSISGCRRKMAWRSSLN
jgi:NADPH:quinone reductase-like Zn-dependent oxidoreductase